MKRLALVIVSTLMFVSCPCDYYNEWMILLCNASKDTLCVYVASGNFGYGPTAYPDTMLPKDFWMKRERYGVTRFSYYISHRFYPPRPAIWDDILMLEYPDDYENTSASCILPLDTLSVFFICKDTLDRYGYNNVQEYNRVQLRIDFSKADLDQLNKEIPYPPRPEMRHMHMSPSYDEFYKWYDNHRK
jgi:hypothetical protein